MPPSSRIQNALKKIKRWMLENDAPLLVENLAPGATPAELAEAESKLGFPLPPELRDLWAIHNGQNDEQNGFVESFDLLSVRAPSPNASRRCRSSTSCARTRGHGRKRA